MPKPSNNSGFLFLKSVQISESHCGPAVLQMLLGNIGIDISQQAIAEAAGITKTIARDGTRIDHMVKAIENLHINARLWYKAQSTIQDIGLLLDTYRYPVGVEWQGLFETEDTEVDGTSGHYSIVTRVDGQNKALIIVDPYKDFAAQDRIIRNTTFLKRWWDENEIDTASGKVKTIRDNQVLFIVTPLSIQLPESLQILSGSEYVARQLMSFA